MRQREVNTRRGRGPDGAAIDPEVRLRPSRRSKVSTAPAGDPKKKDSPPSRGKLLTLLMAGLFLAVICVYWRVWENGFVNFDDDLYVYANEHVKSGLTFESLRWAFTSIGYVYYQPLTWISHMLDVEWFGLHPGGHHFVSVVLHGLSSAALLLWLFRITGKLWNSTIAAALFALHPLRVESVAWIAERKDVLSTALFIVACIAYSNYAIRPSGRRYALLLVAFVSGLLTKPMLVATPFLFLLLDYWPLRRRERLGTRVREKIPLLLLAGISAALTFAGQKEAGAMSGLPDLTLFQRLANAALAYPRYLGKTFWPYPLAVLYPYDRNLPFWQVALALLFLTALSAAVLKHRRRLPYLTVGWFWFLISLLPVIGLVQVGIQAYADRFTYIPSIGLLIAIVWGLSDQLARFPNWRPIAIAAASTVLVACTILTYRQIWIWHNGITLFQNAVDNTHKNALAEHNLGFALTENDRNAEAIPHLRNAVEWQPRYFQAHYNLGKALASEGQTGAAASSFSAAIRLKPDYAEAYYARASMDGTLGDWPKAEADYEEALRLSLAPAFQAEAYNNLGVIEARDGQLGTALKNFQNAVAIRPDMPGAQVNLSNAFAATGRRDEALKQLQNAEAVTGGDASVRAALIRLQGGDAARK